MGIPAARGGRAGPDDPAAAVPVSDRDTAVDGGWPVDPDLVAPPVFEPSRDRSHQERGFVVVEPPRRSAPWVAFAVLALAVIAALAVGLLWALSREASPQRSASPAASPAGERSVPNLVGQPLRTARQLLASQGLPVAVRRTPSSRAHGVVLAQSPAAGAQLAQGEKVLLVVADGAGAGLPDLVGLDARVAEKLVGGLGLAARIRRQSSNQPANVVLQQDPAAGQRLAKGQAVTLTVSSGQARSTVPRLTGLSETAATSALKQAGLQVEATTRPSAQPAGMVVGQSVAAGEHVDSKATVRLEVSSGPAKVLMPRLAGVTLAQAEAQLHGRGLSVTVTHVISSQPAGTVVGQDPIAGAQLRRGMTVTVRVASAAAKILVPDVTGLDTAAARQQLTGAGFRVQVVDQTVTDTSQDGVVLDESPAGASRAAKGSTVTITVGRASTQ